MKIVKINSVKLKEIIKLIKKGKVMVFPTDTVYGLIADATNKAAVSKVFKIKKRKRKSAVPIFVKDLKVARKIAKIKKEQEQILKTIWPGRVTAVLERKKVKLYGVKRKTVALRIPDYELVNKLLKKTARPLTGTSANISGKPPLTGIKKIIASFRSKKHQPDLIVDAGNLPENKPSTILDLTVSPPEILRQ